MRNISVLVDFSSGLNLYPDLRLCNNSVQYDESVARIASVLAPALLNLAQPCSTHLAQPIASVLAPGLSVSRGPGSVDFDHGVSL